MYRPAAKHDDFSIFTRRDMAKIYNFQIRIGEMYAEKSERSILQRLYYPTTAEVLKLLLRFAE